MRNENILIAILAIMLGVIGTASAETINLLNSNTAELSGIKIEATTSGNTISIKLINNPLDNSPIGIDNFYYNLDGNGLYKIPVGGVNEAGWVTNFDGINIAGWGNFLSRKSHNPGGTGGIGSPLVFTFSNLIPTISPNGLPNNARIAVHIRYSDDCSGWVSDGTPNSVDSDTKCRPKTAIPEFPTIALPIAAVIGLVFFFQHKKKKEE